MSSILFTQCQGKPYKEAGFLHHVRRSYPTFIAHTNSCARPKSSTCFHVYAGNLCRLFRIPAGRWPFPTLSLQSFHRCLDPYPAASLRCMRPFLPEGHRSHLTVHKFDPPTHSAATSSEGTISGLQSFRYVQAPLLARPPGCSHNEARSPHSGRAFYTTQLSCGYPT